MKGIWLVLTCAITLVVGEEAKYESISGGNGNLTSPGYSGMYTHNDTAVWTFSKSTSDESTSSVLLNLSTMGMQFINANDDQRCNAELTIAGLSACRFQSGTCVVINFGTTWCDVTPPPDCGNTVWMKRTGSFNVSLQVHQKMSQNGVRKFYATYEYLACLESTTSSTEPSIPVLEVEESTMVTEESTTHSTNSNQFQPSDTDRTPMASDSTASLPCTQGSTQPQDGLVVPIVLGALLGIVTVTLVAVSIRLCMVNRVKPLKDGDEIGDNEYVDDGYTMMYSTIQERPPPTMQRQESHISQVVVNDAYHMDA